MCLISCWKRCGCRPMMTSQLCGPTHAHTPLSRYDIRVMKQVRCSADGKVSSSPVDNAQIHNDNEGKHWVWAVERLQPSPWNHKDWGFHSIYNLTNYSFKLQFDFPRADGVVHVFLGFQGCTSSCQDLQYTVGPGWCSDQSLPSPT